MRLALTVNCWIDEDLMFTQQLSATHVMAEAIGPDADGQWDVRTLAALRNRVEKAGLELIGINRLPQQLDRTILGKTGRDEEIEAVCRFVEDAGAAGIPLLCYEWVTSTASHDVTQMWHHITYFLERVIPVAEKAGVRMAYSPGDALTATTGEAAALNSVEGLKRLMEIVPGSCHGLDFHPSVLVATPGTDVMEAARFFGSNEKIFMITTDNIINEGDIDILEVLQTCRASGFRGPLRPGRQPAMPPDTDWGHKARALAVGYLRALLQAIEQGR